MTDYIHLEDIIRVLRDEDPDKVCKWGYCNEPSDPGRTKKTDACESWRAIGDPVVTDQDLPAVVYVDPEIARLVRDRSTGDSVRVYLTKRALHEPYHSLTSPLVEQMAEALGSVVYSGGHDQVCELMMATRGCRCGYDDAKAALAAYDAAMPDEPGTTRREGESLDDFLARIREGE